MIEDVLVRVKLLCQYIYLDLISLLHT